MGKSCVEPLDRDETEITKVLKASVMVWVRGDKTEAEFPKTWCLSESEGKKRAFRVTMKFLV